MRRNNWQARLAPLPAARDRTAGKSSDCVDGLFLRGLSGRFSSEANISGEASSAVPEAPQSSVRHVPDVARLRRDPQVSRTRQAGSRQELRRRCRKLLRQCRLNAQRKKREQQHEAEEKEMKELAGHGTLGGAIVFFIKVLFLIRRI